MTQVRLKHQGRGRLGLDLWQGPLDVWRETMNYSGTKWSQPERAARFASRCAAVHSPQACPAIPSIASPALPTVLAGASLSGVEGGHGVLEAVRWSGPGGDEVRRPIRDLFFFDNANPNTDWLAGPHVILDAKGLTGAEVGKTNRTSATNAPGILAIGGVRSGSVKRVAAAVGEGAQAVVALDALPAAAAPSGAAVGQH